jgi:glycerol-3-phosphate dehydrogenase
VSNYVSLARAERRGERWECRLDDKLTGAEATITARTVVNAAGAWADRFAASRVKLRLTKGVHLVVPHARLPVPECVVMTDGSRILFAIPWGERTILGTTDTDYAGDPGRPTCEPDDVDYVLGITNRSFPAAGLTASDVVSTWAGLRPLIADPSGRPSDVSRAHQIRMTEPGWFDVAGGKLTTYRLMGEQTVDQVGQYLGAPVRPSATAHEPLLPAGGDSDASGAAFSGVVPPAVSHAAVVHYCRHEWAVHLDDVVVRRSGWQHYHDDPAGVARAALGWMAESLGWTPDEARAEWDRYVCETGALAAPDRSPAPREVGELEAPSRDESYDVPRRAANRFGGPSTFA